MSAEERTDQVTGVNVPAEERTGQAAEVNVPAEERTGQVAEVNVPAEERTDQLQDTSADRDISPVGRLKGLAGNSMLHVIILGIWPLFACGRGLSLADPLYALSNYQYFGTMGGTWELATILANAFGAFISRMPGAGSVLGMQIYTSLIMSAFLIALYFLLMDTFGKINTFLGLFTACAFAWCPSVILYNRLTYILFSIATCLLIRAVFSEDDRRSMILFILSGVILGLNVSVKFSNADEALLIVLLIFDKKQRRIRDILLCIAGWLSGFLIPVAVAALCYGIEAYTGMINILFTMQQGGADDYTFYSMVREILSSYGDALIFMVPMMAVMGVVTLLSGRLYHRGDTGRRICYAAAYCGMALWLRFAWGRGMFDLKYFHYNAIYLWGVLGTIAVLVLALYVLLDKRQWKMMRAWALAVMVIVLVTPLGSNNSLYPVVDNMFLICPFGIWAGSRAVKDRKLSRMKPALTASLTTILLMLILQGSLFHMNFAIQDGYWGESRTYLTSENKRSKGVMTTKDNAALIDSLTELSKEYSLQGNEGIFYGNMPGLCYILDMPSPLTTIWPSLPSFTRGEWERDTQKAFQGSPVIFFSEDCPKDYKYESLMGFIEERGYARIFHEKGMDVYMEDPGK
ncbi:MAG: hypothetical protein K6E33_04610 [Lachnospiraceae bacterium]|nr:hypothetical protein [Lachnospiraceae bacterium]